MADLDKFYTREHVVEQCLDLYDQALRGIGLDPSVMTHLEPSAGGGAFLRGMDSRGWSYLAYDLVPESPGITEADFLTEDLNMSGHRPISVIGNPPYGKRSRLALNFISRAFLYSPVIGFILPVQFEKYLTQKRVTEQARLVSSTRLPEDSFNEGEKVRDIRSVFQVWTTLPVSEDLRIRTAPPTHHPDFVMHCFNCTPECEWMFDSDYDFAVLRQGWGQFTPIEHGVPLNRSKQWMFYSSESEEVLERLRTLDYEKLSMNNTTVRGYGKADVVAEYMRLYGEGGEK